MQRFEPIFRYYHLSSSRSVVEIDPQNGTDWPFHLLVYCEFNEETGKWDLYQNEKVTLNITKDTKEEALREACLQLVTRQNQGGQL